VVGQLHRSTTGRRHGLGKSVVSVITLPKCPVCEQEMSSLVIKPKSSLYEGDMGTSYHMMAQFRCGATAEKPPKYEKYHWTVGCPNAMPTAGQV